MGRKAKEGLGYFPMDVDMYSDEKVMDLVNDYGAQAVAVYVWLLGRIYEKGYWIALDRHVCGRISMQTRISTAEAEKIIRGCVEVGLFDQRLYAQGILTSRGLQARYRDICQQRKLKRNIEEYNLLDEEAVERGEGIERNERDGGINSDLFGINSEKSGINSEENGINSEEIGKEKGINSEKSGINSEKSSEKSRESSEIFGESSEKVPNFLSFENKKEKNKNIISSSTTSPARESAGLEEQEDAWYSAAMNDEGYISHSTEGLTETTRQVVGIEAFKAFGAAFHTEKLAVKEYHESYEHYCKHLYEWTRRQIEIRQEKQRKAKGKGAASSGGKPAAKVEGVGVVVEKSDGIDKAREEREMIMATWNDAMKGNARSMELIKAWMENGRLERAGFTANLEGKALVWNRRGGKEVAV